MTDTLLRPLTSRTRVALATARGIAASLGHDDLTAAHIVLGLLHEGRNPAVAVLHHGGVALEAVRREIEAELPARGRTSPREVALPPTPGEQRVIDRADTEARLRNDEYLGTEHLLLAIVRDEGDPTARLLARHDFSFEKALTHLRLVLDARPEPPSAPPAAQP